MTDGQYVILIREPHSRAQWRRLIWHPCIEGPWDSYQAAETFARNEVGVPWIIVRVVSIEGQGDPNFAGPVPGWAE
jgi:hypothetical protein